MGARTAASNSSTIFAMMGVFSTSGVELCLEGTLSDGYPDWGAWSPYGLATGDGFGSSDYVMLDD